MAAGPATIPKAFPFGAASQLASVVRSGQISAVELLHAYLARVDEFNGELNAIIVDDRDRALRAARAADEAQRAGEPLGPLHGVPMTVKECFAIPGHPVTYGSPALADNIADYDAVAVARLRRAGAVIFGKTNVPLALSDIQSYNDVYGTTNNPWDRTCGAGGSSGGSAVATAAGLTGMDFGSDIGGSIRNPAAYNGVFGHKPTYGIIPKRGQSISPEVVVEGPLSVVGPIARSADDLLTALQVTAGPDLETGYRLSLPDHPPSLRGLRVALWASQPDLAPVDDSIAERVESVADMLARAGARIDRRARPDFDPAAADAVYRQLAMSAMAVRAPDFDDLVRRAEALPSDVSSSTAIGLRNMTMRYRTFAIAENEQVRLRWAWRRFFADYDVVLAPITATPPFPHDHSEPIGERTMTVNGANVPYFAQLFWAGLAITAHLPSTVAPAGTTRDGLPIGLQVIADAYHDRTTIWAADQIARLTGGFTPPPAYA